MTPEIESEMSAGDLLDDLRRLPGWWLTYLDLDTLAQRALAAGCLKDAHAVAWARWWSAYGSSSNSSATVVVMGPDGRTEDTQALLLLLRHELIANVNPCKAVGEFSR